MRNNKLRWLTALGLVTAMGLTATADDFICMRRQGCRAEVDTPEGSEVVRFYEGDVVSSEEGWVVDSQDGWDVLD